MNWSRDVLATCRRPHGIAHFDLTVALAGAGAATEVLRWRRLQPEDLWREDGPLSRLVALLGDGARELQVNAALFSWGEAAHYALTR